MNIRTLLSFGLRISLVAAVKHVGRQANSPCATGVHMIVARASQEMPGEGIIGAVATMVKAQVPGSDSEAVVYPATLQNYTTSEGDGVSATRTLIENYVQRCPNSKIALLGYSQGAQVIEDTFCGTSSNPSVFNSTPALTADFSSKIVAIVQMGDPTFVVGQPQNVGNATKSGIFPRLDTASCSGLTTIGASYCDDNDTFCASGNSIPVHLSYVTTYGQAATTFIISKLANSTSPQPSSSSCSSSLTGTNTSSSTTCTTNSTAPTASASGSGTGSGGSMSPPISAASASMERFMGSSVWALFSLVLFGLCV